MRGFAEAAGVLHDAVERDQRRDAELSHHDRRQAMCTTAPWSCELW